MTLGNGFLKTAALLVGLIVLSAGLFLIFLKYEDHTIVNLGFMVSLFLVITLVAIKILFFSYRALAYDGSGHFLLKYLGVLFGWIVLFANLLLFMDYSPQDWHGIPPLFYPIVGSILFFYVLFLFYGYRKIGERRFGSRGQNYIRFSGWVLALYISAHLTFLPNRESQFSVLGISTGSIAGYAFSISVGLILWLYGKGKIDATGKILDKPAQRNIARMLSLLASFMLFFCIAIIFLISVYFYFYPLRWR